MKQTKLKKILKTLKTDFKLEFLLALLPISALVWIIGQVTILSKYNAVVFFSWSQVFSDTAILIMLIVAFAVWYFIKELFDTLSPSKTEKFRWFMFIVYSIFLIILFISLFKFTNLYFVALSFFYLIWYTTSIFSKVWTPAKKIDWKYWIFIFPTLPLTILLAVFIMLYGFFGMWYSYLYKNIEVKVNEEHIPVNYMNDKFIIYWEGKVLPNNWNNEFQIKEIPGSK